jgi:hypothetical protein
LLEMTRIARNAKVTLLLMHTSVTYSLVEGVNLPLINSPLSSEIQMVLFDTREG